MPMAALLLVKNLDQGDAIWHVVGRGADVNAIDNKGNTPVHEVMKGKMLRKRYENGELSPATWFSEKSAR